MLGCELSDKQIDQLAAFAALVVKWNKSFNLISRQDVIRVLDRHILDSIAPMNLLRGRNVMDLGSGAGLPGLPLAIARPDLNVTLCDRNERRMRFCRQVVQQLGLTNVTVWCGNFGASDSPTGPFDNVVARGVATSNQVWDMVQHTLSADGRVLVYAATQDGEAVRKQTELNNNTTPAKQDEIRISQHDFNIPNLDRIHSVLELQRIPA